MKWINGFVMLVGAVTVIVLAFTGRNGRYS
jgi:hypothetical protein